MDFDFSTPEVKRTDRQITYRWKTGRTQPDLDEADGGEILLTLSVWHEKAGANMFAGTVHDAHLGAKVVNEMELGGMVRTRMFSGLGLPQEPLARFSAKRLDDYATRMVEQLKQLTLEDNPQVLPYVRGEKAGNA